MMGKQTSARERVAVIGGGMGGLSAAIHLRLAGLEVTLYEANEAVGGRAGQIQAEGFTFDAGPTLLNYPWVFEQLFARAGRRLADVVELLPVDPSITFRWPDGQDFTLSSNACTLVREVERIEPGGAAGLWAFMADAQEKYRLAFDKLACRNAGSLLSWIIRLKPAELWRTAVWRSLDRELARFFASRHLREALGSYGMYLGGSPHDLPGFFSILPYGELAHGLWLPRGGIHALVRAIEALAADLGARILKKAPVRKILHRDGAVCGIELADGRTERFGAVVSNVDVPTTWCTLLGGEHARARSLRMTPSVMTFYWGIRGRIAGLGHHTIFLPADARRGYEDLMRREQIPQELPFYISIASASDPALAPPGDSAVFVLVPLPRLSRLEGRAPEGLVAEIRDSVLKRLAVHGIVIDPAARATERVMTPADWAGRFGLFDGSAFGAAHTLMQMGPLRCPNRDRRLRGLYYVGASTTPGTGLPMVALGGAMTAERVLDDLR